MDAISSDITAVFEDGEVQLHSQMLRAASPVFDAMLGSDMKESQMRRIEVTIATRDEFLLFYELIQPFAWDPSKVAEENFETLLKISSYYQVEPLKQRCASILDALPATVSRLMLARKHGLTEQTEKFVYELATNLSVETANELKADPSVVKEVLDPVSQGIIKITTINVEGLLILNSSYPIEEIQEQCGPVFAQLKASVPRLVLAHQLGLKDPFENFAKEITLSIHTHDLKPLMNHSEVMMHLLFLVQKCVLDMDNTTLNNGWYGDRWVGNIVDGIKFWRLP